MPSSRIKSLVALAGFAPRDVAGNLESSEPAARSAAREWPRADRVFVIVVFLAALVASALVTTNNWRSGFLLGHEFRQTQTAVIAEYIDAQNNFSPHYDTPIMGKPWEIPLELPIYEWAVVLLSRLTHRPLVESARTVSLASFYLMLPAIYLLLGSAGLSRLRRLVALSMVLATPVYLFYSRTFLMDTMALMFSAWFLAGFVQTMRTRKIGWFLLCTVAGTAGGLLKSLTFFAWAFPAAIYGVYCLWQSWTKRTSWAEVARTAAWGLGTMVLPTIALQWWVRMTDAIKEQHASAYFLTSKNLSVYNYGTFSLTSRFSLETWRDWFTCWQQAITSPWVIAVIVLIGVLFVVRERWRLIAAVGLFMAPQMMIPYAYSKQDYYYVACAVFLSCGFGFVVNGIMDSRLPRWVRWLATLLPLAALYVAYAGYYFPQHRVRSAGGTGLTTALRDYLPRESVVIVAGNDWAAIVPYYSKHRTLLIRNGLETDFKYLERAFNDIADEDVSALVLAYNQRGNQQLRAFAASKFNLDAEPTFSYWDAADIYVSKFHRPQVLEHLRQGPALEGITSKAKPEPPGDNNVPTVVTPGAAAAMFKAVSPAPIKYRFDHGYQIWNIANRDRINAHPNSELWIKPPPGAKEIEWEFGFIDDAYKRDGDKTNGADFFVDLESADGRHTRRVFRRLLDPLRVEHDRGLQREKIRFQAEPGEVLVFRTGSNGSFAYDWCYWGQIIVR